MAFPPPSMVGGALPHAFLGSPLLDRQRLIIHDRAVDEDPLRRHLERATVEIGAALRRQLLEQIEAVAAYERLHPAINWPIEDTFIIRVLDRKFV